MERLPFILPTTHRFQMACFVLATLMLTITSGNAAANADNGMTRVEVFTTADMENVDEAAIDIKDLHRNIDLQFYPLNGIQLVETELSKGLTSQPDQSKRLVLQRIQILDDQTQRRMQRSAVGLSRAMQYGIDRLPAIVFDGRVVVYGVTDLQVALTYFRVWRAGNRP